MNAEREDSAVDTGTMKWQQLSLPGLLMKRADHRGRVYGVQVNSVTDMQGRACSSVRIFVDYQEVASMHTKLGKVATEKMVSGAVNALISYHDVQRAKKARAAGKELAR